MIIKYEIFNTKTGEILAYTDNETILDIIIVNLDRLGVPYDYQITPEYIEFMEEN